MKKRDFAKLWGDVYHGLKADKLEALPIAEKKIYQ